MKLGARGKSANPGSRGGGGLKAGNEIYEVGDDIYEDDESSGVEEGADNI